MSILIVMLIILLLIGLIVICIGVGIGFILSILISELTLGMGIVAGAIFSVGIVYFWVKLISAIGKNPDIFEYEDEEPEVEDKEPFIILPPQHYPKTSRKKRIKKKRHNTQVKK